MSATPLSTSEMSFPLDAATATQPTEVDSDAVVRMLRQPRRPRRLQRWAGATLHHVKRHAGLGIICAVAYFDPGNWSVDLQAGSQFGYKLLFIVLLAGLMAVVFQVMASRLGCVTGLDLAAHCRLLLYNRPKHPRLYRWLLLYPLYALSEIAIISTDLAELLGTATALSLLFPALPLWAGVLLTASDVFIVLAFCSPVQGQSRPQRMFELLIAALVLSVFICLIFVIAQVKPGWGDAFYGFVPSSTIFKPGALYTSIGIIGATVMPHGIFLGSSLATQDRVSPPPKKVQPSDADSVASLPSPFCEVDEKKNCLFPFDLNKRWLSSVFRSWRVSDTEDLKLPNDKEGHAGWQNNSLSFVRAHLRHGIADIVLSLLGFAVVINSLILIISSAVFYYGPSGDDGSDGSVADLFEAYALIKQRVGKTAAILFALALLCAGESAGITATFAGQIVSEGFLRWHVSPVIRRALTRLIGLIPSMLVAAIMGRAGLNALLVASQVILSFVLPFVAFPLVWITSSPKLMSVRRDSDPEERVDGANGASGETRRVGDPEANKCETVDFSNGRVMMSLGYLIWLVILVANAYVLIALFLGKDSCEFLPCQYQETELKLATRVTSMEQLFTHTSRTYSRTVYIFSRHRTSLFLGIDKIAV